MNDNRMKRALDVQRMVAQHYEPGRHDRCKLWVYRHHVRPLYHISEATFFRYLAVKDTTTKKAGDS
jgi:hypothetical protein